MMKRPAGEAFMDCFYRGVRSTGMVHIIASLVLRPPLDVESGKSASRLSGISPPRFSIKHGDEKYDRRSRRDNRHR